VPGLIRVMSQNPIGENPSILVQWHFELLAVMPGKWVTKVMYCLRYMQKSRTILLVRGPFKRVMFIKSGHVSYLHNYDMYYHVKPHSCIATWMDAVQAWYDEVALFTYGNQSFNSFSEVGHYTQVLLIVLRTSLTANNGILLCASMTEQLCWEWCRNWHLE